MERKTGGGGILAGHNENGQEFELAWILALKLNYLSSSTEFYFVHFVILHTVFASNYNRRR